MQFICIVNNPAFAKPKKTPFDIVIKIKNIQKALDVIDDIIGKDLVAKKKSPKVFLDSFLQGTAWIDESRLIVIGINTKQKKLSGFIFLPFTKPNMFLETAYSAYLGKNYYIIKYPLTKKKIIKNNVRKSLIKISQTKTLHSITVEFSIKDILAEYKGQIFDSLDKNLKFKPNKKTKQNKNIGHDIDPKDIKTVLTNIIKVADQIDTFSFGIDINKKKIGIFADTKANNNTILAKLFSPNPKTTLFKKYNPNYMFNFKVQKYDVKGFVELLDQSLGKLYQKMGVNFKAIVRVSKYFTGETAGGMSFIDGKNNFESISVLSNHASDKYSGKDFLQKVYIPWFLDYGKAMTNQLRKQEKIKIKNLIVKGKDSKVNGYKVFGIKMQIPISQINKISLNKKSSKNKPLKNKPSNIKSAKFLVYNLRMTTINNLLLIASDDKRLKKIIKIAKTLKSKPLKGPIFGFDVNVTDYFNSFSKFYPSLKTGVKNLKFNSKRPNKLFYQIDMKNKTASFKVNMDIFDIKKIIGTVDSIDKTRKFPNQYEKKRGANKDSAIYWLDKGSLFSTYGNYKIAIEYFQKALELQPEKNDKAYFMLAVSYGEMANFEKAIILINKSIEIAPKKGEYYFTRGRIYLLMGENKFQALNDIKKAEKLGNNDAKAYLRYRKKIKNKNKGKR